MIVNKAAMQVVAVTKPDKDIPILDNVYFDSDGTVVGANRKLIVCVSPVSEEMRTAMPLPDGDCDAVAINSESVKEVVKGLPRDVKYQGILENAVLTQTDKGVVFTWTDGKRQRNVAAKVYSRQYTNYQAIVAKGLSAKKKSVKVVLNRKRLMALLETLEKTCPDPTGESPVYIEFSDDGDILVRSQNYATQQRVIAVMSAYKGVEGEWLELSQWEKEILKHAATNNTRSNESNNDDPGHAAGRVVCKPAPGRVSADAVGSVKKKPAPGRRTDSPLQADKKLPPRRKQAGPVKRGAVRKGA